MDEYILKLKLSETATMYINLLELYTWKKTEFKKLLDQIKRSYMMPYFDKMTALDKLGKWASHFEDEQRDLYNKYGVKKSANNALRMHELGMMCATMRVDINRREGGENDV